MAENSTCTDQQSFDSIFEEFSMTFRESLKEIIKQEGYEKFTVEKTVIPQAGNFLSTLYKVDVTGETAAGKKITPLFIKKAVTLDKITVGEVSKLYSKEVLIYNELSRIFLSLQNAANVPRCEQFGILKSYFSNSDVIVMENLSKKGFKSYDGKQAITIKFAELSIGALAKFHALSYVVKERSPKYFEDNIKTIKYSYDINSDWKGFVHNLCATTAQVLKGEANLKMKTYAPRFIQLYKTLIIDMVPENGCLCHGDYKILNILVKEQDGEPVAVQPIDYQLMYYGNPVDDLLFFIFTSTDRQFRTKHFNYLKEFYYQSFSNYIKYFNIDVELTYPREEFEKDCRERLELGLVFGLYISAFNFAHVDEGFDVRKRSLAELPIIPDEMFGDRVKGLVEDYIEWGIL